MARAATLSLVSAMATHTAESTSAPATPPSAPAPAAPIGTESAPGWTIEAAKALYNIEGWGAGFFDVNAKGHVVVRPDADHPDRELDLYELASDMEEQGVQLPV